MNLMLIALIVALATVLAAEFVNGWTDAPNVIATVVSTGVLPPRLAVAMAVVFNILGAMGGTAVAATVGTGIVEPSAITLPAITAAMLSIIAWGAIAAHLGIPVSKSHALLAGLAGAGLAGGGWPALQWTGWQKVGIGLICSLGLGFSGALLIGKAVIASAGSARPATAKRTFDRLQLLSAAFMAYNHGLNDGQKFMGAFTLALVIGGALPEFVIPTWVIFLCAGVMALGTSVGGWKIMKTLGMRLTHLKTHQGFAAEMAAASTIELASRLGIPLSTTHTISTSIMGVGAVRGLNAVRWGVTARIVGAWLLTFPICGAVAYGTVTLAKWVTG